MGRTERQGRTEETQGLVKEGERKEIDKNIQEQDGEAGERNTEEDVNIKKLNAHRSTECPPERKTKPRQRKRGALDLCGKQADVRMETAFQLIQLVSAAAAWGRFPNERRLSDSSAHSPHRMVFQIPTVSSVAVKFCLKKKPKSRTVGTHCAGESDEILAAGGGL